MYYLFIEGTYRERSDNIATMAVDDAAVAYCRRAL